MVPLRLYLLLPKCLVFVCVSKILDRILVQWLKFQLNVATVEWIIICIPRSHSHTRTCIQTYLHICLEIWINWFTLEGAAMSLQSSLLFFSPRFVLLLWPLQRCCSLVAPCGSNRSIDKTLRQRSQPMLCALLQFFLIAFFFSFIATALTSTCCTLAVSSNLSLSSRPPTPPSLPLSPAQVPQLSVTAFVFYSLGREVLIQGITGCFK